MRGTVAKRIRKECANNGTHYNEENTLAMTNFGVKSLGSHSDNPHGLVNSQITIHYRDDTLEVAIKRAKLAHYGHIMSYSDWRKYAR